MRRNGDESSVMGTLHIKNQTLTIVLSLSLSLHIYIYIYIYVYVYVCVCSVGDFKGSVIAGFDII